jgi:hypothetical protein
MLGALRRLRTGCRIAYLQSLADSGEDWDQYPVRNLRMDQCRSLLPDRPCFYPSYPQHLTYARFPHSPHVDHWSRDGYSWSDPDLLPMESRQAGYRPGSHHVGGRHSFSAAHSGHHQAHELLTP